MPFRSLSALGITNLIYNAPPRCKLGGFLLRFDAGLFGGYEALLFLRFEGLIYHGDEASNTEPL